MAVKEIPLDKIRLDGETQAREKIDLPTVDRYSEELTEGAEFPPAVAFFDGADYWLGDGFHRWHAHKKAGFGTMPCDVRQGSQADAQWFACSGKPNGTHGLYRSNADKRKQVLLALAHPLGEKESDRAIGEHCFVSHTFVGKVRSERDSTVNRLQSVERKGRDGRTINTANIGKKSETRVTPAPVTPPSEDDCDWGDEEETAPRETVVDGVSWVETEEDQKATLSDDDWNEAEADIKAEKDRKNHARGYLKAAHKSLAALQENCLNASRLKAPIDLKVIDNHAKSLYSLVEKARTSL